MKGLIRSIIISFAVLMANGSNFAIAGEVAAADVLNETGRNIPESGFEIRGSGISSDGTGTAYSKHTFTLDSGTKSVSDTEWYFKLKKANGELVAVSAGYGDSFTIKEIYAYDDYLVDSNGCLSGTIESSYAVDGIYQDAIPLALSLELKPIIFSIEKQIQHNSDYSYNVILDIDYAVADYITIDVEEEFNPAVTSFQFYDPFTAHLKTGKISIFYDCWITVEVSNQYGTASETLYFPAEYPQYDENYALKDIKYDYNVIDDNGSLDCVGKLSFSIPVAENVSSMILLKSKPHYPADKEVWISTKLPIDIEPNQTVVEFQQESILWGTYFQMAYYLKDGRVKESPMYCTNTYISQADLDRLTGLDSVDGIVQDDCGFSFNSATRTLEVKEGASVEIFDITGRVLFSGTGEQNVSLAHLQGRCVVVRCVTNNGVTNKKLVL